GRPTHLDHAAVLAPHARVLDGPGDLRSRAVLRGTAGGQVAPLRLGAVRRRGAQVPRHDLRQPRIEAGAQRTATPLRVVGPAGLRAAHEERLAALPRGRPAGLAAT